MLKMSRATYLALLVTLCVYVARPAYSQTPSFGNVINPYFSIQVGIDHLNHFTEAVGGGATVRIPTTDGALVAGSFGARFNNGLRLELEVNYNTHQVAAPFNGHISTFAIVPNLMFDFPFINASNAWKLSLGGGMGLAEVNFCTGFGAAVCTGATTMGVKVQAIGELSYQTSPNLQIFLQARDSAILGAQNLGALNQQSALVGFRYFPLFENPASLNRDRRPGDR